MLRRSWLLAGLLPVLAVGCGRGEAGPQVQDATMARLPVEARQQVMATEQRVMAAEANVSTAEVAQRDAERFRQVAQQEQRAAQAQLEAAQTAAQLGQQAQDAELLRNAQQNLRISQQRLQAAGAKQQYADRLLELRRSQVEAFEADRDLARSTAELEKMQVAQQHQIPLDTEPQEFMRAQQEAAQRAQQQRQEVEQMQQEVQQLRQEWEQRARAAGEAPATLPIEPPAPPQPLEVPGFRR